MRISQEGFETSADVQFSPEFHLYEKDVPSSKT